MEDLKKPKLRRGPERNQLGHYGLGTDAPWYQPQTLSKERRLAFSEMSKRSAKAKRRALDGHVDAEQHEINLPKFRPETLMPQLPSSGLRALSLFSGGGGLDLGFDRAGFQHVESYEVVTDAAHTLVSNRPEWNVKSGHDGDVTRIDWRTLKGRVDVIHAGPPCQPFSSAGRQMGDADNRNLFPEFIRAVREIKPVVVVAENVRALLNGKFREFVQEQIVKPLSREYSVSVFELNAASFGVPQVRTRVFFVGFRRDLGVHYSPPTPTHHCPYVNGDELPPLAAAMQAEPLLRCMGAREALGLPETGFDALAPTLRSGLTGPRHTTSILSSVSALKLWNRLAIWPNGVAQSREMAQKFVPENRHFRLSVPDCALLQGFPESWKFRGAVYKSIGQIGNSVAPPMAYQVGLSILRCLSLSS
jgi:DNA (cytosine-5)-methyltransferase 1